MKKAVAFILVFCLCLGLCACASKAEKEANYNEAVSLAKAKKYAEAVELLEKYPDYEDSKTLIMDYKYAQALKLLGVRDPYELPSIKEKENLDKQLKMWYYDFGHEYDVAQAYDILKELNDNNYGYNTEYLMELTYSLIN